MNPCITLPARSRLTLAKITFQRLAVALALCWVTTPALATTRIWRGNDNNLWSNPVNWSPFGVPQNGDSLTFASPGFAGGFLNNDLPNLTVETLLFTQGGYTINGNTLTFNQGITD